MSLSRERETAGRDDAAYCHTIAKERLIANNGLSKLTLSELWLQPARRYPSYPILDYDLAAVDPFVPPWHGAAPGAY